MNLFLRVCECVCVCIILHFHSQEGQVIKGLWSLYWLFALPSVTLLNSLATSCFSCSLPLSLPFPCSSSFPGSLSPLKGWATSLPLPAFISCRNAGANRQVWSRGTAGVLSSVKDAPGDFPRGAVDRNPPAKAGDTGLIPGPGRSHVPRGNQGCEPQLPRPGAGACLPQPLKPVLHSRKWNEEVARPCPILCDPMDCSLPGFSIHGIFQARVLEWGAREAPK